MAKKKMTALLSLVILPTTFNVISCGKTIVDKKFPFNPDGTEDSKTKKAINALKNDEEIKEINAQISKIKHILKEGIDGSKDFTPSQSLSDISVQKRIAEKIKKLCNNPENIKFMPQLKSQYFKAGSENYVDVEIIYTKKDFQITSMYHDLQIKNIKQNLEELVQKALEDLKDPVDFIDSFLIEHDDFQYKNIQNEFINVLKNRLEQDDERLSIRLVNKSQDLLNHRKIHIEVIGKDDNDEIKRTTQITPINLLTVQNYIDSLVRFIPITRNDKLFANDAIYNPGYAKTEVKNKIKAKFDKLNGMQLERREIESFTINPDLNIDFKKGDDVIPIIIKLKYNEWFTDIVLNLLNIENHPEFILNQVANYFETNYLDLSNQPLFEDSDFEAEDVKRKIIEIMKLEKIRIDQEKDIEIEISNYDPSLKHYSIIFSHKKPNIIEWWKHSHRIQKSIILKNIQKSPQQDLEDFFDKLIIKNSIIAPIEINIDNFDELYKYSSYQDSKLKEDNAYLNTYLESHVREKGLSFLKLSVADRLNLQINPVKIISKNSTSIEVKYQFEFKKLEVIGSLQKNITFKKAVVI